MSPGQTLHEEMSMWKLSPDENSSVKIRLTYCWHWVLGGGENITYFLLYCHTRLHLGFSAKLRIWQDSACKMEAQCSIFLNQEPPTHQSCKKTFFTRYPDFQPKNVRIMFLLNFSIIWRIKLNKCLFSSQFSLYLELNFVINQQYCSLLC